jgi:hypothetical protein
MMQDLRRVVLLRVSQNVGKLCLVRVVAAHLLNPYPNNLGLRLSIETTMAKATKRSMSLTPRNLPGSAQDLINAP